MMLPEYLTRRDWNVTVPESCELASRALLMGSND